MVVQFGRAVGYPADQPDIEFVVAVQPGEPTLGGGRTSCRQQMVVVAAENVVGEPIGDVQQVGWTQAGGSQGHGNSRKRKTDGSGGQGGQA
jgi:hypothetical protein